MEFRESRIGNTIPDFLPPFPFLNLLRDRDAAIRKKAPREIKDGVLESSGKTFTIFYAM